jgi:hypothetical protein
VKCLGGALVCALLLALAGCGDSDSEETQATPTATIPSQTTTTAAPTGPMVRICDGRLSREVTTALREQGYRGRLGSQPSPSGAARLSGCELAGKDAEVSISLDAAAGAVRRYHNRVTETAQFSGGEPDRAPQTVKGVGDPQLGSAGANWLPRIHLLLSARGERVLIVDISVEPLGDARLLAAAKTISVDAWDRLH